jgi:HK97 family phage prohead protease
LEQILERVAPTELTIRGDGRTVYGIAVPFDREANVNDGQGFYREVFRSGSFTKTINESGGRVKFLANHKRDSPIGKAVSLKEDAAGLIGEFRVSATRAGDEALELVRDGVYDSFSIGFAKVPGKDREHKTGLVERLEVKLREVSILAFPAYEGAVVSGVRSQFTDEELERLLVAIKNLDTQTIEAAARTSDDEPSTIPNEPEAGHSRGTPTREQRIAALILRGIPLVQNQRDSSAA